ncbi:MAG: VOC family protein [Deltaproteobacteria bacterium]|nr:VOC family protein [Deltaproteobacteria bacterium]MBW2417085.1 VOC family protein [Deltaproteobacteria bacterium]
MSLQLLVPGVEVGVVTTNLDPMLAFYRDMLGLEHQGELAFPGGSMQRFALGQSTLKLVSYDEPPAGEVVPGGGQAARGLRYITLVVGNAREMLAKLEAAGHPIVEPISEFVPGAGFFFTADPDGNWVELAGPI